MAQKPKIEYVTRFYSYGSEAQKLAPAPKKPKSVLPQVHLERVEKIYIDPLALGGVVLALVLLTVLILGVVRLNDSWQAYNALQNRLDDLKVRNSELTHNYRTGINTEAVREAAENSGYVDASEVEHIKVHVKVPKLPEEPTKWDDFKWFLSHLFDNAGKQNQRTP